MKLETDDNTDSLIEHSTSTGNLMDSRTSQLDDVLNEKLESAFYKPTSQIFIHDVAKIACEYDPIDLAHAVTRLPPSARIVVYDNLPDLNAKIIFIINTGSSTRSAIFRQIDDQEIKNLLEQMPPDEGVEILDDLSDRRLKRVLELLDPKKAASIRQLQQHDRNSAGRLMTNEFFAFHMNTTIGEVTAHIRDNPGIELTRSVFVTSDDGSLAGLVSGRNLMVNPHFLPLRQVMQPVLHKVTAENSRDEVVDLVERYKIPALPVVNEQDQLVGVITYEDVVEAMEDIADETIANIAGTAEDVSEQAPIFQRFLWRAPWLCVTRWTRHIDGYVPFQRSYLVSIRSVLCSFDSWDVWKCWHPMQYHISPRDVYRNIILRNTTKRHGSRIGSRIGHRFCIWSLLWMCCFPSKLSRDS